MPDKKSEKNIHHKKRGNKLGFWFFKSSLKIFGLSGAYGLLYLVCPYYLFFNREVYSSSMVYINKRYKNHNAINKLYLAYKLLVNQGKNLIDRYYVISGGEQFDIEEKHNEKVETLLNDPEKGAILLTAHVGNWQIVLTALGKLNKTIYLLMRPEDNIAVKRTLGIDEENEKIKVISPERFQDAVVEIIKVLDQGNIVSIMGDRPYDYKSVEAEFLGEKAYFPYGAFSIAAAIGCPVVVMLTARVSAKRYLLYYPNIIEPCYRQKRKKQQEIKGWVQEFVRNLEDYVAQYPLQWFVFQDIWTDKQD